MKATEELPLEPLTLDDDLWEELFDLTHGAIGPCYQCGVCTATCPWGKVREKPFTIRTLIHLSQLGLMEGFDAVWSCSACAQCEASCPRGVPIVDVIRSLRYLLWSRNAPLQGLPSALWSIYWNNNPWTQPPSQRAQWAQKLDLPAFNRDMHEALLYVGCTSSYDRRAQKIALALVKLLRAADVEFGYLGEEEPCCGEAALNLGHHRYFEELAQQASKVFHDRGVGRVITISPHCFDVFANHLHEMGDDFQPQHYTQALAELIQRGRLTFAKALDLKVTFNDPCFLGRRNNIYDPPREILSTIPRVSLVEMENYRGEALCCGGGGGRMWMETPAGERFSDLRVREAIATGAEILATACPFCIVCLEDSLKGLRSNEIAVLDVAELAALALH